MKRKLKLKIVLLLLFVTIFGFSSYVNADSLYLGIREDSYERVNGDAKYKYIVNSGKLLKYISVNGTSYALTFKTMTAKDGHEPGTFYVYCVDHDLGSPSSSFAYLDWGSLGNETTYCLKHGWPYAHFTNDDEKDYYITNVALQILNVDKDGYYDPKSNATRKTNALAKYIWDGNCYDPENLRPYIIQLVNESKAHTSGLQLNLNKVNQLTKNGNDYVTNVINLDTDDSLDYFNVNTNSGIEVINKTDKSFQLKIPSSVYNSNLKDALESVSVTAKYEGGDNVVIGGIFGQQTVVTLKDASLTSNVSVDIFGNLKVVKKDVYGKAISGVTFHVSGPSGDRDLVTGEDGTASWDNVIYGDYTITETNVPANLVLDSTPRTINVPLFKTATYTATNDYQRGTVTLIKTDSDGKIEGSPRLDGAVFGLYAAEEIKEGDKTIYSANQAIDENIVTNADGTTKVFTNMPIGKYYYKELKNPYGYYKNDGVFEVEVKYQGQDSPNATDEKAECKDEQKYNDIVIIKKIQATSNTPEDYLAGAQFTATLQHREDDYNTDAVVGTSEYLGNGKYIIRHLPVGDYNVEETVVPDTTLKSKDYSVTIDQGDKEKTDPYVLDETKAKEGYGYINDNGELVDISKKMNITVYKEDTDTKTVPQGDATLDGAKYGIYKDKECTDMVEELTIAKNADGTHSATSGWYLVGTYYVKETKAGEGYFIDDTVYEVKQVPSEQTQEFSTHTITSKEQIKKFNFNVIKFDDKLNTTDESSASGAILRLTLDKDSSQTYTVTIDKDGHACFEDIPYGTYSLTEDATNSNYYLKIDKKTIVLKDSNPNVETDNGKFVTYMILSDDVTWSYLDIQKVDRDTQKIVALAGTKVKIYRVHSEVNDPEGWVSLIVNGKWMNEFTTDETGKFITTSALSAGEYRIYETEAPEGYYLNDEYKIPEDASKVGKEGGLFVQIDTASNVAKIITNPVTGEQTPQINENIIDEDLKVKLDIYKEGEQLTGIKETTKKVGDETYTIKTPVYENRPLEGVTFKVYAAEDIKTPDGKNTYNKKGDLVATITTGEDGHAVTGELHQGKYSIEEVSGPKGMIFEDIEDQTLTHEDKSVRVETKELDLTNTKQPTKLTFKKNFNSFDYVVPTESLEADFAICAGEDIVGYDGKNLIRQDDIVDIVSCKETGNVESNVNLPEGNYYVKEIYVSRPYLATEDEYPFSIKFTDNENKTIEAKLNEDIDNTVEYASLRVYKVSDSSLMEAADGVFTGKTVEETLNGDESTLSEVDKANREKINDKIEELQILKEDELVKELENKKINLISGAEYTVYVDKDCTKPLQREINGKAEDVVLVTNVNGYAQANNIPLGIYYIKEKKAPIYVTNDGDKISYDVAENTVKVELTIDEKDKLVFRILPDSIVEGATFTKTDIFTGEIIPNCTFEILDENKNIVFHDVTDKDGIGHIPVDILKNGKTYYLNEISAPDIYDLNTDLHEFVASYKVTENGEIEWTGEKVEVENRRKTSTVTLEKLDMMDSTPIPNCKFELRSLETDYVVTGVTDENGHYVFENVPYGKYTYTELEAPEEYMIDTTPHEIEINAQEMKIQVHDEKKPDTGDIAVVALSIIAVASVAGIVYVTLKNKNENA